MIKICFSIFSIFVKMLLFLNFGQHFYQFYFLRQFFVSNIYFKHNSFYSHLDFDPIFFHINKQINKHMWVKFSSSYALFKEISSMQDGTLNFWTARFFNICKIWNMQKIFCKYVVKICKILSITAQNMQNIFIGFHDQRHNEDWKSFDFCSFWPPSSIVGFCSLDIRTCNIRIRM